ncbi:Gaa1-domain-containing protein [Athelia psychrophila]|uniref:Gaa1-domain-containing protein n=1 Tax=Athelia psychrophila TaxID=1759441 RepID=A0A166BG80_9AGAM|nr:Gaa1-domain-containing protein [Fibularhizoctonia sp. CBS 109695]
MDKIKAKLRALVTPKPDATASRIRRRRAITAKIYAKLPWITTTLFAVGYAWMLCIPFSELENRIYIDENALQPGQVNTQWEWSDVHHADMYLRQLEILRDSNATSEQRADFLANEFNKLGIASSTQSYTFSTSSSTAAGTNAYAVLSSPRTSGNEAIVISASWLSRIDESSTSDPETINIRGVATVLALAKFLRGYSLWAKDLVFVISDGHLDGMHAWLSAYHGVSQSNMDADYLKLSSGVIWTALNIDYPGHSFSHLGVFFEGLNGRLPNQDLLNSLRVIANRAGVPVVTYDHISPPELPSSLPSFLRDNRDVKLYAENARSVLRHVGYEARGSGSGVHGLLHQFRIDAITIFAIPAAGPHGFHAIGRVIESTLRTANNLLERLHASFFFYIMTSSDTFLKIGAFLPSAVLVSVAMMFVGLGEWVRAGWVRGPDRVAEKAGSEVEWLKRRRPLMKPLGIVLGTHVFGAGVFGALNAFADHHSLLTPVVFLVSALPITLSFLNSAPKPPTNEIAQLSTLLKSLNLCLASTIISVTSVLNFSLALTLAILLGLPLSLASPSTSAAVKTAKYACYLALAFGWLLMDTEVKSALWNWEVLGVWVAPFVCVVYAPLVLQAGLVTIL